VLRGIAGFGASGRLYTALPLDISLNLPLMAAFFDAPERAQAAIRRIHDYVGPGHVVTWGAELSMGDR